MTNKKTYRLQDFNFDLPDDLIAQYPSEKRENSRLLVLDKNSGSVIHDTFEYLGRYLKKGDALVLNNTRVVPARMFFKRHSGGVVEILLVRQSDERRWLALSNRTKRIKKGEILTSLVLPEVEIKVNGFVDDRIEVESSVTFDESLLAQIGKMPLPPYIRRDADTSDIERYQTVYASEIGAVASPTAGLHFTDELIFSLQNEGVRFIFLTLHVSWSTFQPVRDDDLQKHRMHSERYNFSKESADELNSIRGSGGRIIAVGTTSLRVLESRFNGKHYLPGSGETDIFIYPPYVIGSIDGLITNFHTPRSTLLMLVASFGGYELIMDTYKEAVRNRYRFFSYGDSMAIF